MGPWAKTLSLVMAFVTSLTPPSRAFVTSLTSPSPEQPMRHDNNESSSSTSTEEEDVLSQLYEPLDIVATRFYELHCDPDKLFGFNGHPCSIKWDYKAKGNFKYKSYQKFKLISQHTTLEDEGNYTCTLTSSNGTTIQKTFNVCVTQSEDPQDPPVMGTVSPETLAEKGAGVSLECKAFIGSVRCLNPYRYLVQWSKLDANGSRLVPIGKEDEEGFVIRQAMHEDGMLWGQLEIRRILPHHYGTYVCNITNQYGSLLQHVTLLDGVPPAMRRNRLLWLACAVLLFVSIFMPTAVCVLQHIRVDFALYYRSKTFLHACAEGFTYDVLVVHGETSFPWVMEKLLPALEGHYRCKCYIPQRNMLGGEETISRITEIVEQSRQVMVIVTPCLLEDPDCLWAIFRAFNAAMKTPTTILPIVLQPINEIRDCPDQILTFLKKLKSQQIRVPRSCQLNESQKKDHQVTKTNAEGEIKRDGKEMGGTCSLLRLPGLEGEESTVRSRSSSPKQKLKNMITAVNANSVSLLQPAGATEVEEVGVTKRDQASDDKGEIIDNKGGGGDCCNSHGDTKRQNLMLNFSPTHERCEIEQELPETPCSTTLMISFRKTRCDRTGKKHRVWKWARAVYAGDDERLFWKRIRLRLPAPVKSEVDKNCRSI